MLNKNESIILNGTYRNLSLDDHVWIFLEDIYGGYYVQSPPIHLFADGTWEVTNIRPRDEIRYIVVVYVNSEGNSVLEGLVEAEGWARMNRNRVRELGGYLELARVKIITPGVSVPKLTAPNPTSQSLALGNDLILDDFAPKDVSTTNCSPFGNEIATALLSYCSYSVNTIPELYHTNLENGEHGLKVVYSLPPHPTPGWGNWITIRKEFDTPIDLSNYTGLKLSFRVEKPSETLLRITLVDSERDEDIGVKGRDELWWCNVEHVLGDIRGEWQTVNCPFKDFVLGVVDRNNNKKLDLTRIVAYEFTIVSEPETNPDGVIVIDSIVAYDAQ